MWRSHFACHTCICSLHWVLCISFWAAMSDVMLLHSTDAYHSTNYPRSGDITRTRKKKKQANFRRIWLAYGRVWLGVSLWGLSRRLLHRILSCPCQLSGTANNGLSSTFNSSLWSPKISWLPYEYNSNSQFSNLDSCVRNLQYPSTLISKWEPSKFKYKEGARLFHLLVSAYQKG